MWHWTEYYLASFIINWHDVISQVSTFRPLSILVTSEDDNCIEIGSTMAVVVWIAPVESLQVKTTVHCLIIYARGGDKNDKMTHTKLIAISFSQS